MENLRDLTIDELIEILSTQTSLYVLMHSEGASEKDFQNADYYCKQSKQKSNRVVRLN